MKHPAFAIWVLIGLASIVQAAPDLGQYRDIEGVRLYRDHQKPSLWYLAPAAPVLRQQGDGAPDYDLTLYRYFGRKGTGDAGSFWARGVLTLGVERSREPAVSGRIRKALRHAGVRSPRLRTMPVSASRVTLLFADQSLFWEHGVRWQGGAVVLPLDTHMAQVLWDAVEAGQTQVSLSVDETLSGVRQKAEVWEAAHAGLSWALPVAMDMAAHPDRFQRYDLGGRMKIGYTGLDVFCFDFLEGLENGLYAKIVEVAIPTRSRELVETVTFKDDGEYRARIEFKLAKDLDRPYRVRILRVWEDGREEAGPWEEKTGETLLDITAYREDDDDAKADSDPAPDS